MLLLLASLALAGPVDEVRQLEWNRAPVAEVAVYVAHEDPEARVAAAVALGRLRDEAAAEPLGHLLEDEDVRVRRAAAEGLGYTPGSVARIRAALDTVSAEGETSIHVRLIESLGFQGEAEDVDRLVALLAQPWPQVGAAAEALGRMARREVEGVERSVGALGGCTRRPAPPTAEACSWALWRVGLEHGDSNDITRSAWRVRTAGSALLRERMLRASWAHLDDEGRRAMFEHALRDPARGTRAAALSLVQEGQVDVDDVTPSLSSGDPWIWENAVGALGRLGGEEAVLALQGQLDDASAWRRGAVVEAMLVAGATPAWHDDDPVPVRAALVKQLPAERQVALAVGDPSAIMRTAAAMALLERGDAAMAGPLAASEDEVVRQIAAELAGEPDPTELPVVLPEIDPHLSGAVVVTTRGSFKIGFDNELAPVAANNFARLAEADFYDNVAFHRVIPGFVAQTGCPRGDGTGDPGWRIPDEVSRGPWQAGGVGMARADRDTGGSQWFVTTGVHPHLEGEYTWFGQVTRGMEVVNRLDRGDLILDVVVERAR